MILKQCNKYSFIQQKQIATRKSKMAKKNTRLAEKVALNFKNWKNEKWSKRIRMHIASSGLPANSNSRYEKSAATRTKKWQSHNRSAKITKSLQCAPVEANNARCIPVVAKLVARRAAKSMNTQTHRRRRKTITTRTLTSVRNDNRKREACWVARTYFRSQFIKSSERSESAQRQLGHTHVVYTIYMYNTHIYNIVCAKFDNKRLHLV